MVSRIQWTMVKKSPSSWFHRNADDVLVHVNVGGLKKTLCSSTLKKFPDTRLGKLVACASEEDILQVGRGQNIPSEWPITCYFASSSTGV